MLKQRVLTAMVLVAVLLGVMLGLPPMATVWLVTILILIGAWEWAAFTGRSTPAARALFTAVIAGALLGSLYLYASQPQFVRVVMIVVQPQYQQSVWQKGIWKYNERSCSVLLFSTISSAMSAQPIVSVKRVAGGYEV